MNARDLPELHVCCRDQIAAKQTDWMHQIMLILRNFSQPNAVEMQPTNLHDSIDNTLLIFRDRLRSKSTTSGIQIVREYGDLPLVECYSEKINQVFRTLISNAIDVLETAQVSPKGLEADRPQITIRTLHIPDPQGGVPRAIIGIADNGPGIPFATQETLFEMPEGDAPEARSGLLLSYDIIVRKHGGELHCYSQPGEGTEFWIELPVYRLHVEDRLTDRFYPDTLPFPTNDVLFFSA